MADLGRISGKLSSSMTKPYIIVSGSVHHDIAPHDIADHCPETGRGPVKKLMPKPVHHLCSLRHFAQRFFCALRILASPPADILRGPPRPFRLKRSPES